MVEDSVAVPELCFGVVVDLVLLLLSGVGPLHYLLGCKTTYSTERQTPRMEQE